MIDVALHHARLAERSVRTAQHMLRHFLGIPATGFDFQHVAVKFLEIIVHGFEILSSGLFALHRRTVTRHELFVVAVEKQS